MTASSIADFPAQAVWTQSHPTILQQRGMVWIPSRSSPSAQQTQAHLVTRKRQKNTQMDLHPPPSLIGCWMVPFHVILLGCFCWEVLQSLSEVLVDLGFTILWHTHAGTHKHVQNYIAFLDVFLCNLESIKRESGQSTFPSEENPPRPKSGEHCWCWSNTETNTNRGLWIKTKHAKKVLKASQVLETTHYKFVEPICRHKHLRVNWRFGILKTPSPHVPTIIVTSHYSLSVPFPLGFPFRSSGLPLHQPPCHHSRGWDSIFRCYWPHDLDASMSQDAALFQNMRLDLHKSLCFDKLLIILSKRTHTWWNIWV